MDNKYKVVNGTSYKENTPDAVINILETARQNGTRVRLFFGNKESGLDWMESYDVIGTIGRSCGNIKIPLLIKKSNSMGGPAILDDCIVKITIDKKVVYQHPNYHMPTLGVKTSDDEKSNSEYPWCVYYTDEASNFKVVVNAKTLSDAQKYLKFYKGERNCF